MRQANVDLASLADRGRALLLAGLLLLVLIVPAFAEGEGADDLSGSGGDGDSYTLVGDPGDGSTLASPTAWRDVCVRQRMEITAIGMGDRHHAINPQTVSLADPASVNWLLAQVAGRGTSRPDSVTLTTDAPESLTLSVPNTSSMHGYTFETNLQPTRHFTASVSQVGDSYKTPRGLVLYGKRATRNRWVSVGKTTQEYVWTGGGPSDHTEVLALPTFAEAADLYVSAVVIDNDDDSRPMVVEATAGGVTGSVSEFGSTHGAGLNVVDLRLSQVPTGTSRVRVTLRSPSENGDSLVLVGLNASFVCPAVQPTLRGSVRMHGRPPGPSPSRAVPLTVWLSPAGDGVPTHIFTTHTDQKGEFELYLEGVPPGVYEVAVKGSHTLRNLVPSVRLDAGDNAYFFGTLLEGDVEEVATYNQVRQADADLLIAALDQCADDPGYMANADLDENGCVSLPDFGMLSGNFDREGDAVVSATTDLPPELLLEGGGGALMAFDVESMAVAVDEIVTLSLQVDPRGQSVNGAMVHLRFDPSLVEIVEVTLGDRLPFTLVEPWVDNGQGAVRLAVGALGQVLTERFLVAKLSLRVKAATTGTPIVLVGDPPATDVSGRRGSVLTERRGVILWTEASGPSEDAP